ncbi:DUF3618 domain-containing protein [Nigerium massiliense]|uniref:DUF3618 domain-containing protein n=1 Tax=Nigerium massiliense TaxID=1522317 RepID=UPI00058F554C|nr:DUF3618 domain-containing protein [Nigerium massiliense]
MAPSQNTAQIEAELAEARRRLASNVEGLISQVHPQAMKTRAINDAKDFAAEEVNSASEHIRDANGDIDWERVGYLAVAVVGTIAFAVVFKSIFRR